MSAEEGSAIAISIVSLVLAVITVNGWYRLLMKITGSNAMYYSIKKKMTGYFIVWMLYVGVIGSIFGFG